MERMVYVKILSYLYKKIMEFFVLGIIGFFFFFFLREFQFITSAPNDSSLSSN